MATLKEQIITLLVRQPNLSDREITNLLRSTTDNQQPVNQACRELERLGKIVRQRRADGLIANRVSAGHASVTATPQKQSNVAPKPLDGNQTGSLSEDATKQFLSVWLEKEGWNVEIAWGKARGIDILATRGTERWIMEAKGCGSLQPMRVNYFLGALGELLQRMSDPTARYSVAFPDLAQFRGLWNRLPELVKERLNITSLFVEADGTVHEEH